MQGRRALEAPVISTVALATSVFAFTNVDDLFVLAALFAVPDFPRRTIVLGQYIGILVLFGVSAIAAIAAWSIPLPWIALTGVVPIAMGIRRFFRRQHAASDAPEASGLAQVVGVTVANGGDNLGVYVPLFGSHRTDLPIFGIVFAVLTGLWCFLGWWLVKHPILGRPLRRWGNAVLPLVLIAIGVHILVGALPLLRP